MLRKSLPANDTSNPHAAPGERHWLLQVLLIAAGLITLMAAFYTEENWRGKRAWKRAERELLAKGARLDWASFIPAPVPDDQNIFKAPNMGHWFIKGNPGELSMRISDATRSGGKGAVRLAELRVVPTGTGGKASLRLNDPRAPEQLRTAIQAVAGPALNGSQGLVVSARPIMAYSLSLDFPKNGIDSSKDVIHWPL